MATRQERRQEALDATDQVNTLLLRGVPKAVFQTTGGRRLAWNEHIQSVRKSPPAHDTLRNDDVAVKVGKDLRKRLETTFRLDPEGLWDSDVSGFTDDLRSLQQAFSQRVVMPEFVSNDVDSGVKPPHGRSLSASFALDRPIDEHFDDKHFADFVRALELPPALRDAVLRGEWPATKRPETFPNFAQPFIDELGKEARRDPDEVLTTVRQWHRNSRPEAVTDLVVQATHGYPDPSYRVDRQSELWNRVHDTLNKGLSRVVNAREAKAEDVRAVVKECFEVARSDRTEPGRDAAADRAPRTPAPAYLAGAGITPAQPSTSDSAGSHGSPAGSPRTKERPGHGPIEV